VKALFITYNGALEPLIQSQGIPYLKGLRRKGVETVLLSFEKVRGTPAEFKAETAALRGHLLNHGIRWYRLKYHKRPSVPATLYDILAGVITGIWIVLREKVDIVHARGTVPAAMGYVISRVLNKRFVHDARGLMAEEYADGGIWKRNGLVYKAVSSLEKKFMCAADAVVVLTDTIKRILTGGSYIQDAVMRDPARITVIPCCVDLQLFRRADAGRLKQEYGLENKFIILYAGSLGTWYLVNEMVDFYIAARETIPDAHLFFLVNTGRELAEASCRSRNLGPADVTITGADFNRVPLFMSMSDAGIYFIKQCFSKQASCPTTLAEYLAAGLPVIANSGIGDGDTVIESNGVGEIVRSFDTRCYRQAALRLAAVRQNRADDVGARCRRTAQDLFSLDKGVESYLSVYRGAMRT
jgi:glycosyltransferase involved in cell wall biosynthesis